MGTKIGVLPQCAKAGKSIKLIFYALPISRPKIEVLALFYGLLWTKYDYSLLSTLYISQQKQFAALWGEKVVNKCVSNGPCPSSSSSKQSILFFGVSFFTRKKNYSVSAKSLSSLTIRLMWTKSRKSEGRVSYLSCTASLMGFLNFTLCFVALIIWIVGVRQNQSQFDPENCLCHKIVYLSQCLKGT